MDGRIVGIELQDHIPTLIKGGKADALTRGTQDRPSKQGGEDSQNLVNRVLNSSTVHETPTESDWKLLDAVQEGKPAMMASVHIAQMHTPKFEKEFLESVQSAGQQDEEWKRVFESLSTRAGKVDGKVELKDGVLWREGLLWVPLSKQLKKVVLEAEHDSKIAGHFGRDKTYERITRNFTWPQMESDIDDYVTTCPTCRHNKASRHKRFGMLSALETPEAPWSDTLMDFITTLPSSRGMTQICVIVDRFTKMPHFVALPTNADADMLVTVFLREIWHLHGLPASIISDRDSKFTSAHWKEVMRRLGIKLRMSTAFPGRHLDRRNDSTKSLRCSYGSSAISSRMIGLISCPWQSSHTMIP